MWLKEKCLMMDDKKSLLIAAVILSIAALFHSAHAAKAMWTFSPLTATTVAVPPGTTLTIQYQVSNQSSRAKNLVLLPTNGLSQVGACQVAAKGEAGSSCTLNLLVNGSNLPSDGIQQGPILCEADLDGNANPNQCYQPSGNNVLQIVRLPQLVIGQQFQGGIVACLNGEKANLIVSNVDFVADWGDTDTLVGANSTTDGAANTSLIVAAQGPGAYAAKLCDDYEVDSMGLTPCQAGNTCYSDWFLPAGNNTTPSGQLNCLVTNKDAIGLQNSLYWSSTEVFNNSIFAWFQNALNAAEGAGNKSVNARVVCVRAFTIS